MEVWNYANLWETVARATPDRPALIHGEQVLTWDQFDGRANGLARRLVEKGLTHQSKVAAYLYNGPEYIETYYAAFKAGLVPFNTNYRYSGDELVYLFDNADAEAVVFHASFAETAASVRGRLPKVKAWIAVAEDGFPVPDWAEDYDAIVAQGGDRFEAPWGRSADDLLFMYTGGTTGMPKGVMWRQEDLFKGLGGGANLLLGLPPLETVEEAGVRAKANAASPEPQAITIPVAPLMHATGQFISFGQLISGGAIATLPSRKFDPASLFDEVERLGVSGLIIVGLAFAAPMLECLEANPGRWTMPSLKRIVSSGTMWSAENKQGLLKHLPNIMLMDSLGSSEALGLASSASGGGVSAATAKFATGPNAAVFTEDGRRVAPGSGERGLVAVGGHTPLGYYKDEEKSAKTFRIFEGQRWSVPGDWATVEADGAITLLGRGSQVINTGGEKVFPEEVEEALKRFPGVRDAAVVGLPDPRFGERICAVVDVAGGAEPSLADLQAHVKSNLADYKVPRDLVFAPVVRAPNGKLDYKLVRAQALDSLGAKT
ncbi:MAG: acyl-CoA synthetase [Phenylobacterium sp.]|uniref:acyl-CoA synthetase n=1 Tax=Phenylobacterium sp. TaxID=1871053 RepID=UPI002723D0D5|nr:acyl-CoA synthetase [Phenylobacterium sp.]MDO8901233.1 acyl-CoA synthetase [Phenylobacterium sp.]MDP2215407.1 acyl-CoA synthetase [Phenylobacterium sp.]